MHDDLHSLIQSLDTAERGYFSKWARRHGGGGESNYALLFWVLARMPTYSAEQAETALREAEIASPLPAAKNHLKSMVFKAMRAYHSGQGARTRLLEGLQDLALLQRKRQVSMLRHELLRLQKLAVLHGEHSILLQLGHYESWLHKELGRTEIVQGMDRISSDLARHSEDFQNEFAYLHLYNRLFVVANKGGADRVEMGRQLMDAPLLRSPERARTLQARIYYHQTHAIYQMMVGDSKAAQTHYGAVMSLMESAPQLIAENPGSYRRAMNNYLSICGQTDDYTDFESTLAKVRRSGSKQPSEQAEVFLIGDTAELLWRMGLHDWEGVRRLLPQIEDGLARFESYLSPAAVLGLRYNGIISLLLLNDRRACKRWVRTVTEGTRTEQRMDVQRMARVIGLLLTWLEGDLDFLEYSLRSVQRAMENMGGGPVEDAVLSCIGSLLQIKAQDGARPVLARMAERLAAPALRDAPGSLALRAWALAVAEGRPATEVLRTGME